MYASRDARLTLAGSSGCEPRVGCTVEYRRSAMAASKSLGCVNRLGTLKLAHVPENGEPSRGGVTIGIAAVVGDCLSMGGVVPR